MAQSVPAESSARQPFESADDDAKARVLREIAELRERAAGSRAFVHFIRDGAGATWLEQHAEELEAEADALEAKYMPRIPAGTDVQTETPPGRSQTQRKR